MTTARLSNVINTTASTARLNGQSIELTSLYIAIDCNNGDEYFFQNEDFDNMLKEAELMAEKFDATVEDVLLYMAQGW